MRCPPLPSGTPGETTPRPVGYPEVSLSSTLKRYTEPSIAMVLKALG